MLQMSVRGHARVALFNLSWFCALTGSTLAGQELIPPKADHHVHLFSPAAGQIMRRNINRIAKKQDAAKQDPLVKTASDLIAVLDEAGIKQAVALSAAYLFGASADDQTGADPDEYLNVQQENDWLLQQVKPYAGRLVGFCSEDPLKDYAVREIKRCASIGLSGLKLHFTASNVDLQNPRHIERLKAVFSAADAVKFPILVHLPNCRQQTYGAGMARNFIEKVLPSAPNVIVQVAHMAGECPGGYDSMNDALQAFLQAFASGRLARKNIYFDLSGVAASGFGGQENLTELIKRIHEIGLQHILFATDWPAPVSAGYQKQLRQHLGLELSELQEIFNNTAPYLKW
jgi:predicted TIM-barrel fold metal-dependent hydrolase